MDGHPCDNNERRHISAQDGQDPYFVGAPPEFCVHAYHMRYIPSVIRVLVGNADRGADATCGDSGVRSAETPKMVRVFELMRAMTIRIAHGEWPKPEIHRLTTYGPPEL